MASGSSNVENLPPQVIRSVAKELRQMIADAPEGIRVVLNEKDVTDIQAIIDGPTGTPYQGGAFRVRCVLGKEFPNHPPKAYFTTKVFHPNVSRNGEICVNTLKKDWKPDLGIKHILLTIKCLLIVPNPESALNEEAGKMLLEQYEEYCQRARMMTEIHAIPVKDSSGDKKDAKGSQSSSSQAFTTKTTSSTVTTAAKKAKLKIAARDKKRTLKRL